MYDEMTKTASSGIAGATQRLEGPLTHEVMDTLSRAQDVANEVRHRLYELRDRLMGSPPANQREAPTANGAQPTHFKAAHADRSQNLLLTLGDIDQLSIELANRL